MGDELDARCPGPEPGTCDPPGPGTV